MFDALTTAIEELDVPADGAALVEVLGLHDRLACKVNDALGAFDAEHGWALDHDASLAGWLRNHAGLTGQAAHRLARRAKLLRQLPVTRAAWADGRLSPGQVDAVVAHLTERTVGVFAEHEAEVIPTLVPLPTVDVVIAMRLWKERAEATLDERDRPEDVRELHLSQTLGGTWVGRTTLDSEGGSVVRTALRLAETRDAEGDERTPARRRADALVDIARHYLDHQTEKRGGRHRPHVNVVITLDELEQRRTGGRFDDGGTAPASTVEALLCDCNLHRVITDGAGTILDYGRSTRTTPVNLFNALLVRDGHCRAPECDVPGDRCDSHHVVPWEDGGPTDLDNLVLKCKRHHHLHHQPGWRDTLLPDGTYVVTDPRGRTRTTRPPGFLTAPELAVAA
jgi:hypothetical protein